MTPRYAEPGPVFRATDDHVRLLEDLITEMNRRIGDDPTTAQSLVQQLTNYNELQDRTKRMQISFELKYGPLTQEVFHTKEIPTSAEYDRLNDLMCEFLNAWAPDNHYFGANREDPTLYGYWYHEDL